MGFIVLYFGDFVQRHSLIRSCIYDEALFSIGLVMKNVKLVLNGIDLIAYQHAAVQKLSIGPLACYG